MKKLLASITLFVCSVLFFSAGAAHMVSEKAIRETILNKYLSIHQALIADSLANTRQHASSLGKELKRAKVVKDGNPRLTYIQRIVDKMAIAQDIDEERDLFKQFSNPVVEWVRKKEVRKKNVEIIYCPIVRSYWVQKKGPIRNPFQGKEMLESGERRD